MGRGLACMNSPIFCLFIRFLTIVSTYRYMSETFKDAIGHDWSSKMAERNATWKSLGPEKREVCCLIPG